jgi:hypothetical protein
MVVQFGLAASLTESARLEEDTGFIDGSGHLLSISGR